MKTTRLKKLIIPLIIEQLLTVSVGFIDTLMVARVGAAAVSGVSLVDNINTLIIQVMAAFAAGGIVVISQYIGDGKEDMVKKSCDQLEILMNSFSIAVMLICVIFGRFILKGLFGKVAEDVMEAALIYITVSGISFVFWGMYSAGAAILRCHEDTKTAMKISMLMNLVNVVLNALFLFRFHMGVLGVAVATLISRIMAGLLMKVILLKGWNGLPVGGFRKKKLSFDVMKNILSMGIPSGIENGMFHVGKLVVAGMIAGLGTELIAANSISYQIIEFPNIPGVTIGLALVVIVGQDIGGGKKDEAVSNTKLLLKYAYIGDWIAKSILFVTAPLIVSAFALPEVSSQAAVMVLRCFAVASLLIWPLSYTLPNALRGAGDVTYSMVVSLLGMWCGRVIISFILIVIFRLGILGVWFGMFADWYIRGIGYLLRFRSRKWLEKKAI